MVAVLPRRLLLWKLLALLGFTVAASAVTWAVRHREQVVSIDAEPSATTDEPEMPSTVPSPAAVLTVPTETAEIERQRISALRQAERDTAIVLNIDDLDLAFDELAANDTREEWVKIRAPKAIDDGDFPTPTFNAHHHHH